MNHSEYIESLPFDSNLKNRISVTTNCTDCDYIPKKKNAGETFPNEEIPFQLMHNGIKVLLDGYHGKGITEIIKLLKGHHEPQEEKIFHEILKAIKPNSTVLELGSHWSYYSLWFNKNIKGAINYLIEPDPSNLAVGKTNFDLNGAKGNFFNAFISNKSSDASNFECESDNQIRKIPSVCVDDFIETNKIDFLDMLLVDIQGYELKMLEGLVKTINANKVRFLFLSTHHHTISHDPLIHQKCLDFLKTHNAHILASHDIYESYSADGLIVASFLDSDKSLDTIPISRNYSGNYIFRDPSYDLSEAFKKIDVLSSELSSKNSEIILLTEKLNLLYKSRTWRAIVNVRKIISLVTLARFFKKKTKGI